MKLKVPESIRLEHIQLREQLFYLTREKGYLGDAAHNVMELFYKHYLKEEEKVFPALELLPQLVKGRITDSMTVLKDIACELEAGLYEELLEDHKVCVESLKNLSNSALDQGRMEYVQFADRFILHAQMEEEILYPTVLAIAGYFQLAIQCRRSSNGYFS